MLDKFYFIIENGKTRKVSKQEFEKFEKGKKITHLMLLNKETRAKDGTKRKAD